MKEEDFDKVMEDIEAMVGDVDEKVNPIYVIYEMYQINQIYLIFIIYIFSISIYPIYVAGGERF